MPTKRESKKEQGRGESLIVPMTVIMMRQGYDYWQNKVLLAIIDKLQPYIREGLQIDLFGIQEDIILSIRYKDLGIRRADYSKFRSRLTFEKSTFGTKRELFRFSLLKMAYPYPLHPC